MAIDITVQLSDSEQAVVQELAARIDPTMQPAQIIAWVQQQMKKGLRSGVIEMWQNADVADERAKAVARETTFATRFPAVP